MSRDGERDAMKLLVAIGASPAPALGGIEATLREVTKLGGAVEIVEASALPNDGMVIADERDYSR